MKKNKIITISIIIFLIVISLFVFYLMNYQGAVLYTYLVSGDSGTGHREAREFKDLPTEKVLSIITANGDTTKYPLTHFKRYIMGGRWAGAVEVLGSKTDEKALTKLTEIITTYPEGAKWSAIGSIGRHKNKKIIPILCAALKKHTHWHTDILIVDALVNIDDPSALDCLIQEKDKIESKDARLKAEKAIEKWSNKN